MKKLLFIYLLAPAVLCAQTYVPFISTTDSSDTWLDVYSCTDFSCYETYTNRYKIDGDTTIGGLVYSKIHISYIHEKGADAGMWCDEATTYHDYYFGAIRESDKRIYVIQDGYADPDEYVAYDFNLIVGDTLPAPGMFDTSVASERIISAVDSVLVFGSYRKRYLINDSRYVVEGIGASTGLFNPLIVDMSQCYVAMHCYSENNIPDYFTINCEEMDLNVIELAADTESPELVKIVDLLGRETEYRPNVPLIYIYSDGSAKKIFRVE